MEYDIDRIAMLLGYGAGIRWMNSEVVVDGHFWPFAPKSIPYVNELVDMLVDDIIGSGVKIDYVAAFEDRPATVALAQLVAARLGARGKRRMPTLIVRRDGRSLGFRYHIPGKNGHQGRIVCLKSLRDNRAHRLLFWRNRVLVFASACGNTKSDPTIHLLQVPRVLEKKVRIVGVAALALLTSKTRTKIREVTRKRRLPIFFIHHFDRPDELPSVHGHLPSRFIRRALKHLMRKPQPKTG